MFRDVPNDDGDLWLIRMNTSSWVAASPNAPVGGHEKPPVCIRARQNLGYSCGVQVHKIVSDLKRDHVGAE